MTTKISISICPTAMQVGNDQLNVQAYLEYLRKNIMEEYPDAEITCLQVGYRQGDDWVSVYDSSRGDEELTQELADYINNLDCSDPELYELES